MALWIVLIVILTVILSFVAATLLSSKFRTDMLAGDKAGATVFGILTVKGATIVVIVIGLVGAAIFVGSKLKDVPIIMGGIQIRTTDPAEKIIRDYYNAINSGVAGKVESFEEAWRLLTPRQQSAKQKVFPDYKFPQDYRLLYTSSGYHRILDIKEIGTSSGTMKEFMIVYALSEGHPENPLHKYFSAQTGTRLNDWPSLLDLSSVCDRIVQAIDTHFDLPKEGKERTIIVNKIEEAMRNSPSNKIVGPRLVTELAAAFKLSPKAPSRGERAGGNLRYYDVVESHKIVVIRVGDEWRIDRFLRRGMHANVIHRE